MAHAAEIDSYRDEVVAAPVTFTVGLLFKAKPHTSGTPEQMTDSPDLFCLLLISGEAHSKVAHPLMYKYAT